jgi:DNA-binding NarL/FixJ family response regulator
MENVEFSSAQRPNNNNNVKKGRLAMANLIENKLQVLLIEDSPLLRRLLTETFEEIEGVDVCGFADTEASALEQLEQKQVDIAIIDIELKNGSGIGVLQAMQQQPARYGSPKKVVFSNYSHASMRQRCDNYGIDAFFDKSLQMYELVAYINARIEENE